MFSTLVSLLKIALAFAAIAFALNVIYNLFISPLKAIPGPFLAKIAPQWLVFYDMGGHRTSTIHRAHLRYGSAVRIGPNEVSFSNTESVKELYGHQTTFMKAPWYESASLPPVGVFSLRDRSEHAQRRRLLSQVFTQSNLFESEGLILGHVRKLSKRIAQGSGHPLDMLLLFRLVSFDIVGDLFMGQSFGGLDTAEPPQFLHDMDSKFILSGLEWNLPLLSYLLSALPIRSLKYFMNARVRNAQHGQQAFDQYTKEYGRASGRKDLLSKIMQMKYESGEAPLTDEEMCAEVSNLIFAGTDTTSATLTYLFYELARHPDWQTKLQDELRSTRISMRDESARPYRQIQDLPILDAVVNESLRLHPAAPASLPRVTPAVGRVLDGYFIPEKTIVSMQCYTTQRDPAAFPQPEEFDPGRWLRSTEVGESKDLFMPYSVGVRGCLGKNLAQMELKLITATLIEAYSVSCPSQTTAETMTMTDHFLVRPKGGKCDLVFNRR